MSSPAPIVGARAAAATLLCAALTFASCPGTDDDTTAADDDVSADDDTTADDDSAVDFDLCPTRIDVFGYSNVAFTFCGGFDYPVGVGDDALADGKFEPGWTPYERTLAGMLQARILADGELTGRFGDDWQIRSCATGGGTLDTFVDQVPDEPGDCEVMGNYPGWFSAMCTDEPAPLTVLVANTVNDWCHGGGTDAPAGFEADDADAYQRHFVELLETFVREREPTMLIVSPMHEWHAEQLGSLDAPETCDWLRPEWTRTAPQRWLADPPAGLSTEPIFVETMQDTFRAHHPCCAHLDGVECDTNWFGEAGIPEPGTGDGWVHFGCIGAEALADHWFALLKNQLLEHTYSCGGDGRAQR